MKGTPFLFTLLIGTSMLTLSACDQKTTKSETVQSESVQQNTPKQELQPEVTNETSEQSQSETMPPSPVLAQENNALKTEENTTVTESATKPLKVVKKQTAQNKEKQRVLRVLEQQYQQVRCSPEAEKLGDNSFCRQEERRLMGEIERLKQELR